MSVKAVALLVLGLVTVSTFAYLIQFRGGQGSGNASAPAAQVLWDAKPGRETVRPRQPTPVALNRGPEVADGFRGDVHPLLFGQTRLEVTAQWTRIGTGRDQLHRHLKPALYSWFTDLQPSQPKLTYTERDFSALLPAAVGEVGQIWALDADRMLTILRQFHPQPSMQLVASGRRAGPDGAFAILRAASPAHLDILFRVHAEFYLSPKDRPAGEPLIRAWYTPASFSGRVLVNQKTGTVEHFRLWLPSEKALNVHLTMDVSLVGENRQAHEVVRVERMELTGGDSAVAEKIPWTKALTPAEADNRLAKVFYKFLEIAWAPFDQVLAQARSRRQPIFAIVSWGAFDDQSC